MYDLIVGYLLDLVQVLPWALGFRIMFDLFNSIIFNKRY